MYLLPRDFTPNINLLQGDVLHFIRERFITRYLIPYLLHLDLGTGRFNNISSAREALNSFFGETNILDVRTLSSELQIHVFNLISFLRNGNSDRAFLDNSIRQLCFYFITTEKFEYANNIFIPVHENPWHPGSVEIKFQLKNHLVNYSHESNNPALRDTPVPPAYLDYIEGLPHVHDSGNDNASASSNNNNSLLQGSNPNLDLGHNKYYVLDRDNDSIIRVYKASDCHFGAEGRSNFYQSLNDLPIRVNLTAILGKDHLLLGRTSVIYFNPSQDSISFNFTNYVYLKDLIFYLKKNGWTETT